MAKAAILNFGSFGVVALAGLLLHFAIGRYYGPATLGEFNVVMAIYTVTSQVSVLGIQFALLHKTARLAASPTGTRVVIGKVVSVGIALVTISSLVTSLVLLAGVPYLSQLFGSETISLSLLVIAPGLVFFSINKALLSTLNGLEQLETYALGQALRYVLVMAWLGAWLAADFSGATLPAILTLSEVILTCVLFPAVHRYAKLVLPDLRSSCRKDLTRFGLHSMTSGIVTEANTKIDILVLGAFSSQAVVGVYSVAALIFEGLMQLPLILRTLVNARLATLAEPDRQAELRTFLAPVKLASAFLMTGLGAITLLVYPFFCDIVLRNPVFMEGQTSLAILISGLIIAAAYLPLDMILSQGGRPFAQSTMKAAVALLNLVLNLLLVPLFGMIGAAVGTAVATVFGVLLTIILSRRLLRVAI